MSFDQSSSVFNARYHQLSESHRRITEEIKDLEQRIQHLQEFGKELIKKKGECEVILEKIERLANQNDHSTNSEAGGPVFQKSLSWDFEGLTLKDHSAEREKAAQQLENLVDKLEQQLTKNKVELELIEREMHGQNKMEHNPAKDRERTQEMEPMGDQEIERVSCVTAGDETSANKVQELQIFVDLQKKRIEELLEKLQEMENHIDVLSKQKEELLRVNHQWDEQYNPLKNDKDRTIAELRRKTQTVIGAELQGQRDDLGQQSKKHIAELTQKNEDLHQELAKFQEKQQKTDQLWLAAKKMITEEREARASAIQQTQAVQERCNALENELRLEKQTQGYLKQEIERLASGAERGSGGPSGENSRLSSNVAEEIEMLKQQICVYADDFANERSDRERSKDACELQKEKLKTCENEIALLKEQLKSFKGYFKKERESNVTLKKRLDKAQQEAERTKKENYIHLATIKRLEDENNSVNKLLTEEREQKDYLRNSLNSYEDDLRREKEEIAKLEKKFARKQQETRRRTLQLQSDIDSLQLRCNSLQKDVIVRDDWNHSVLLEIKRLTVENESYTANKQRFQQQVTELQKKCHGMFGQIQEYLARIQMLESNERESRVEIIELRGKCHGMFRQIQEYLNRPQMLESNELLQVLEAIGHDFVPSKLF